MEYANFLRRGLLILGLAGISAPAGAIESTPSEIAVHRGAIILSPDVPYLIQNWKTEQGLPHNAVECLRQTRDGYLWIGTRDGLARFDGFQFTIYNGSTPGFTSDACIDLAEDGTGTLWVATKKGLYRWRNGGFTKFTTAHGLLHDAIRSMTVARDGDLWLATGGGVSHMSQGRFINFPCTVTNHAPNNVTFVQHEIETIAEDRDGRIWIGAPNGLNRLDVEHGRFERQWADEVPTDDTALATVRSLAIDRSGRLWAATDRTLMRQAGTNVTRIALAPTPGDARVKRIYEDADGTIWIVRAGVLFRIAEDRLAGFEYPNGLSDNFVTDALRDREGTLWIGTRYGGLFQLRTPRLRTLTTKDGLPHNAVHSVFPAREGGIWIATDGGAARWRENGVTPLRADSGTAVSSYRVAFEDFSGDLWLGGVGLGWYEPLSAERYLRHSMGGASGAVNVVFEDARRRIWMGLQYGLTCALTNQVREAVPSEFPEARLRKRADRWTYSLGRVGFDRGLVAVEITSNLWAEITMAGRHDHSRKDALPGELIQNAPIGVDAALPNYDIRCVAEDARGILWFGSNGGGVYRFNGERLEVFQSEDGLAGNVVYALWADASGAIWLGTQSGLSRFKDGRFASITTENGLPDNRINQILADDDGNLWSGCHRGVFRASLSNLNAVADAREKRVECLLLNESDGMLNSETSGGSQPSACKTKSGRLWFATGQGLVVVDPAQIKKNEKAPPVFIEQVRFAEQPTGVTNGTVNLPPGGGHHLEIHYTALCFSAPEKVRFRYQLEGIDAQSIETRDRRIAYYTNLKPGRHRFHVTACNNDGVWNETGATLAVWLAPHYYETWWFRTSAALVLGLLGFILLRWRVGELRRIHRLKEQTTLAQERARIAQDLHDDLGTSLTRISLLSEVARRGLDDLPATEKRLSLVSETARQAVDNISELVWSANPRNDTLDNLAGYLREYAARLFDATPIRCELGFPRAVAPVPLTGAFRRNLFLVLKEALNNVLKHASATRVKITLAIQGNTLELAVIDDGCGFVPDAPAPVSGSPVTSSGNGLANMRRRITSLAGAFEIDSHPGVGTSLRVTVSLPPGARANETE